MLSKIGLMRRTFVLALSAIVALPAASLGQAPNDRVPGGHWMRYASVEQAGFDATKLAAAETIKPTTR